MFAPPDIFIDDVCYCVTAGSCINNKTDVISGITKRPQLEASDGSLSERISGDKFKNRTRKNSTFLNPYVMPATTGVKLVVQNMTSCDKGLELCCPTTGYGCGVRNPPVSYAPKPNESSQSEYGAYPWQTAILSNANDYIAAGVLIDHLHVLTVAHKVYKSTNIKCRFGEWNMLENFEALPLQEIDVDDNDIILHPNFTNPYTLKNNVAILRLNYPGVELGLYPTITPACIPNQHLYDLRCWVAGWGYQDFTDKDYTWAMNEVDLPLVNHTKCQDLLRSTRLGPNYNLSAHSFICAGGEVGKDACLGDGGSGLTCLVNGRFYLVGLVAWGIGCKSKIPGVYVNVQSFLPWIQETIKRKEENDPQKSYKPQPLQSTSETTTRKFVKSQEIQKSFKKIRK